MRAEGAMVIGEIKHGHAVDEYNGIPHFNGIAGHDLHPAGPDAHGRVTDVISGHKGIGGGIDVGVAIASQLGAAGKDRRFAGTELLTLHLVGFEIIADVVAHPKHVAGFDADVAVGQDFARLGVHRGVIGGERCSFVFGDNSVGANNGAPGFKFEAAFHGTLNEMAQRHDFDFFGGILRGDHEGEKRDSQQQGNGGKWFHQAGPIKQNAPPLPSDFS